MPPTRKRQRPLDIADPNAISKPPQKALKTDSGSGSQTPRPDPICNYASLKKPDLMAEASHRNLPSSGSKSDLISRLTEADGNKPYTSFPKPELMALATSRGLIKSGNTIDIIARLEEQDKKKQDKWSKAAARNPPISKEQAAKWPVGAKVAPSESRKSFGPNDPCQKLLRRGPTGRPVYDELGFEYSYEKVAGSSRRRRPNFSKIEEMMEREGREEKKIMEIMGCIDKDSYWRVKDAWQDKVSRDLGIPYHEVELEEWEVWHERGFKATREEFEDLDEEEKKRISRLGQGSALRA
jgi:hypothetical protein